MATENLSLMEETQTILLLETEILSLMEETLRNSGVCERGLSSLWRHSQRKSRHSETILLMGTENIPLMEETRTN